MKKIFIIKILFFVIGFASISYAGNTNEPFNLGISDLELYETLGNLSQENKTLQTRAAIGAGLSNQTSLLLQYIVAHNEDLQQLSQFYSIRFFYNPINTIHFDFDIMVKIDDELNVTPCLEFNLDDTEQQQTFGGYLRLNTPLQNAEEQITLILNPGLYVIVNSGQLLFEYQYIHGQSFRNADRFSLGYNYPLGVFELITEFGILHENFDLTFGLIATL